MSDLFFGDVKAEIEKEKIQFLKMVKLKISHKRKSQLVVLHCFVTNRAAVWRLSFAVSFRQKNKLSKALL